MGGWVAARERIERTLYPDFLKIPISMWFYL